MTFYAIAIFKKLILIISLINWKVGGIGISRKKKGGMAGLTGKMGGKVGYENPIVDPQQSDCVPNCSFSKTINAVLRTLTT